MDVSKVKTAVEGVRVEILKVRDAAIAAASAKGANADAIRQLNGIQSLGKADTNLDKVVSRLEDAVKRSSPRVEKADDKVKRSSPRVEKADDKVKPGPVAVAGKK